MINIINTKVRDMKLRTEIPELKRCCFCIPLRYGLLAWGYFRLIIILAAIILFGITFYIIVVFALMFRMPGAAAVYDMIIAGLILAVLVADAVLHIVFIVGAHRKSVKLLRVYYFYSMILLVITALLVILEMILATQTDLFRNRHVGLVMADLAMIFLYLAIQIYVLLIIRSEINKLNNIGDFRFVNNAVGAECTLNYNDGEKGIERDNVEEKTEIEDNNNEACKKANGTCESETSCKDLES